MAKILESRLIKNLGRPKPKAYLTRVLPEKGMEALENLLDLKFWEDESVPPKKVIVDEARDVEILISLLTDDIDAELMDSAPKLKLISQYAVGFDNIDVKAATERGIYVTNTPGVLTDTVADFTFALLLAVARRVVEGDRYVREGKWRVGWGPLIMTGSDVHGKTLGIIGLGRIGKAVALRGKGFGMKILYYDIYRDKRFEEEHKVEYVDLETLLRESDYVSLHTLLTPETRHMIGEKEFGLMKKTAYLINTSRGGVVDQKALYKALKEKKIAGAALDVFEKEPIDPDDPLLKLENVVLAPHAASASMETRTKMALMVAENVEAFLQGRRPPTLVNPEVMEVNPLG